MDFLLDWEEASIVGAVLSAIIMLGYEGLEWSYNFSEMVPWYFDEDKLICSDWISL